MTNKFITLVVGIVLFSIIAGAVWVVLFTPNIKKIKSELTTSHILVNPSRPLPQFSLVNHLNEEFTNQDLKNTWSLLFFGFTFCPDICPTGLFDMARVTSQLKAKEINSQVVFITFDSYRDTPEVLKTYVTHFDKNFLGVTGKQETIDSLIKPFGAYYEFATKDGQVIQIHNEEEARKQQDYLINHTAWVYLISPDGELFAGFPNISNTQNVVDDITLLMENYAFIKSKMI